MDRMRRRLLLAASALATAPAWPAPARALTAADVVARIRAAVGVPWQAETVDRIVAGSADTPVRGVATSFMATLDVLRRAAAMDRNFVVVHEPSFYNHFDKLDALRDDATYRAKRALVDGHGLVVFRFHDHWHMREPDGIGAGMARALDWTDNAVPGRRDEYLFEAMPLRDLVADMAARLGARAVRVLGDPALPVRRVFAAWGYVGWDAELRALAAREDIDVLVVGEAREWELVPYVQDQVDAGARKALVVLGHVASEQAGMRECARWLRGVLDGVPVDFVPAREPLWTLPVTGGGSAPSPR